MNLTTKIKSVQFPNIVDVLSSGKNAKNKINNMNVNKINVHFYYADNRFKTTVEGTIKHESEIPIVYIEYPEKLAFIIPENTLVYDVKQQIFEISVNEKFSHAVKIENFNNKKEVKELIFPIIPENLNYTIVEIEGKTNKSEGKTNKSEDNIVITSKMLSSLGRAKILERTLETSNDGLMIMAFIGALVGFCLGLIVNLKG